MHAVELVAGRRKHEQVYEQREQEQSQLLTGVTGLRPSPGSRKHEAEDDENEQESDRT